MYVGSETPDELELSSARLTVAAKPDVGIDARRRKGLN